MRPSLTRYMTTAERAKDAAHALPIEDLLRKQRERKPLTLAERERIKKYAEANRIKNKKKK